MSLTFRLVEGSPFVKEFRALIFRVASGARPLNAVVGFQFFIRSPCSISVKGKSFHPKFLPCCCSAWGIHGCGYKAENFPVRLDVRSGSDEFMNALNRRSQAEYTASCRPQAVAGKITSAYSLVLLKKIS